MDNSHGVMDAISVLRVLWIGASRQTIVYACSARSITCALNEFERSTISASLGQVLQGMQNNIGTAGNFFRIARRTVLDDDDEGETS
jgi:hypothetical protein